MSRYALPRPAQVEFRSKTYNHDESYEVQARYLAGETRFYGYVSGSMDSLHLSSFKCERGHAQHWAAYERLCKAIEAHRAVIEPINND